jgi:hypothetical protein
MAFVVGVHEAVVTHPEATGDYILELVLKLESVLETIIIVIFLIWLLN